MQRLLISAISLAFLVTLGVAHRDAAFGQEALKITGAKTKELLLYDGQGKLVKKRALSKNENSILVLAISKNGRLLIRIDNEEFWVPKALVKLNRPPPKVASGCQTISKSHASSRGFGGCK